jgi:hypothetical protein
MRRLLVAGLALFSPLAHPPSSAESHKHRSAGTPSPWALSMLLMLLRGVILAGALLMHSISRLAAAGCAVPAPILFAPASQSSLPSEPTVYLFVRTAYSRWHGELGEISVLDGQGKAVAHERHSLPGTKAVQVLRFDIKAKQGEIVIKARVGDKDISASYKIDSKLQAPVRPHTQIVRASYQYSDGCVGSNGFILTIKPFAPAYRVEIDGQSWIVPGRDKWQTEADVGGILTGQIGCSDFAIPTDKPLGLTITPLHADGQDGESWLPGCTRSERGLTCTSPASLRFSGSVK